MNKIEELNGKRILIWGYGREGKSTERFLQKHCKPASLAVFEGKRDEIAEDGYDVIFKSPGIRMDEEHPKYTSQTELFMGLFRGQVIGVTGTKGKSTTSSMIAHVLSHCLTNKVLLVGNMGKPCLDYYDEITEDAIIVFEMSCHQLAHLKVSPHIALFLNLFEEHLDYYGTFEKYFAAKKHITAYQEKGDVLLLGDDVKGVETKAEVIYFSNDGSEPFELQLLGSHNQYNAKFVFYIAKELFHCEEKEILEGLKSFTGLPHRLQYIGSKDGIRFYDDSISTIPEATIKAIESIKKTQTVIVGGMDRNIDYSKLVDYIPKHPEITFLCCYESGRRIYHEVGTAPNMELLADIDEAVKRAMAVTTPGNACVLSPAAASYGYFKDFEARGDYFREVVGTFLLS